MLDDGYYRGPDEGWKTTKIYVRPQNSGYHVIGPVENTRNNLMPAIPEKRLRKTAMLI
jgi:hypothetical protein